MIVWKAIVVFCTVYLLGIFLVANNEREKVFKFVCSKEKKGKYKFKAKMELDLFFGSTAGLPRYVILAFWRGSDLFFFGVKCKWTNIYIKIIF